MTSVNVSTTKATTAVTETQTGIVVTTDGLFGPRSVSAPLALDANANLGLDFNAPLVNSGGKLALDMGPFRDSKRVYVSADSKASDTNNGTSPLEPVATIKKAAEIATPGMLIEVGPGVYAEQLPIRVKRDVGILAQGLRNVRIQPASGYEFNNIFQVDSGFWIWGMELAGHQADLANGLQSWAISFDHQADNTALGASGLGAYIFKSPYVQNCSSITAEDDSGTAGSVSVGDTGGGIEVDGDKCAPNSPIRSMVVDSFTQVNLGGPGCHVRRDGYAQLVSFFGTFCTFHVKADSGGQANLSGGGTSDFGDQGLVADGFSKVPNFKGLARVQAFGADRVEKSITFDIAGDLCTSATNHGLTANDQITFKATDGTLPLGVDTGAIFYVIASGLTSTAFKVSTTQGGTAVNITGSAAGTYQVLRQGALVCDVVSLTANRVGSKSRPNPGQLMFPRVTFPSAGESGSSGNAVSVSAVNGSKATTTIAPNGIDHWYAEGGTATIGGTSYSVLTAAYDNATGSLEFTASGYSPQVGDSVTFADLAFFCPNTGRYVITGSVPIDASGNTVAADAANLAGYRLNFYNEINGGLRNTLEANQVVDFRLRSQISCALHTMEYVGSGTNYDALPWNGGVPNPSKERVELNGGRVFGATINELGDFEIADGVFEIDGTTGSATINTDEFNISGLNFVGPFSRNGGFSTVGVQLREVSDNTALISSTGAPDGNTVPTQDAVKNYVDTTTVQSVDLSAPTGFTSSGGPVTGSGTLDLAFDTGYQGFLTTESTKLAGIETNATRDQSGAEIKALYESQPDTNEFSDAEESKLAGIEAGATQDQTGAEIKVLYEAQPDTNEFSDSEQSKLAGIENNATADQTAAEIRVAYLSNSDTNNFDDAAETKLAGIENNATQDQSAAEIRVAYLSNSDTNNFSDAAQSKLAGIEANATQDQTDAEIKTAYENNNDTNAFTDAEQTKLSGIETGAQVNVPTNLSYASNTRTVSSSTGTDTTLPLAVASGDAGLLTGADKTQLDNLSTNLAGKANLSGGKLAASELPDLAITEFKGAVANQTAMLAITGERGDWVTRSDDGKVYVITGTDPSQASDWTALSYPASDVLSVNGLSGAVVLNADNISDTGTTNKYTTAAEITKLLGIESGATQDQTAVEIRDSYESNSDRNAYTDAEKTKLSGIAAGADVNVATDLTTSRNGSSVSISSSTGTDVTIFPATGSLAGVFTSAEKTKLDGVESGATGDQTAGEIKSAYLSNSDTNNFNDAAQTKLAGIATGAQVNVATDLAYDSSTRTVSSSTGTNAAISEVVASGDSGLITGADKAKLDGIESGATADQTAAQIKSEYLSNSDTNNFDDAAQTKLSGIAAGAEVNVNADWNSSTGDSQILNKPTIPAAYTDSSVDSHLNVSTAATNEVLSFNGSDFDWVPQAGGNVDSVNTQTGAVVIDADDISDSSTTNKFTTAAEQSKLAGISAGAEVNVQPNWNEANSGSDAFIQNKPTIPAAYTDANVDTHLNTSSASSNEVLSWTGTDYDWVAQSGGGGTTDLSYTDATRVIASSTGTDATLPLMSSGNAGLVPASGGGTTNFLRADGTFAAPSGGSGSLATAVYEGPTNAQSITSDAYSVVNIATGVGTPNAVFSNSSGEVTLGAAGTYLAMCTVVLTGTTTNYRWTGELNIEQDITDGNGFAEIGSVRGGYIRVNNGSNNSYISISRIVTTANSTNKIQFQIKRTSNSAGDGTIVADNSTIQIIRLDGIPGTQGPAGTDGNDGAPGASDIPQNSQTGAYVLVAGDNGKHISISTGGVTVPSGVFSVGNVVTIYNNGSSDQTITQGASVTLRLAGTTTTSNRTLAEHGLCTILCVANNTFVISGAGLT